MTAGGSVLRDETLPPKGTTLVLPLELAFTDRPDGEVVEAALEALRPGATQPLIRRKASTRIVAGKKLLLPADLDKACAPTASGGAPPTCTGSTTCVDGACKASFTDPSKLPAYKPDWAGGAADVCKPAGAGAPIVIVGEGQSDYLPLQDMQVVQIEAGPQGGHHIWVAVRVKNVHQSGTITSVTGHLPEIGLDVAPFTVIFTFDPDEGGYCKLAGLRFQLDVDHTIKDFFGHVIEVTVTETDRDGTIGKGTKTLKLSDNTI
jgi:hypothetical protein